MHRIGDSISSSASRRNFNTFRKLCGDDTLDNVVIVTNMWHEVNHESSEARERQLCGSDIFFKPILDKQGRLLRHNNTLYSAQDIVHHCISNRPKLLRIQCELVDLHIDISQTAAGVELHQEFVELEQKHQDVLQNLRIEMQASIPGADDILAGDSKKNSLIPHVALPSGTRAKKKAIVGTIQQTEEKTLRSACRGHPKANDIILGKTEGFPPWPGQVNISSIPRDELISLLF